MTDTDHLPQLYDDPRDRYDVATEIVDRALEIAPETTHHTAAAEPVAAVIQQDDRTVSDDVWELAVNTTATALREGRA